MKRWVQNLKYRYDKPFNRLILIRFVGLLMGYVVLHSCQSETESKQESAPKYLKITAKSVDGISLDMNWDKFLQISSSKYRIDTVENHVFNLDGGGKGILLWEGEEKMYFVYRKSHRPDQVSGIIVLSDRCRTAEGIYIGMPIGELPLLCDSFNIRPNLMPPPDEIFTPTNYQTYKNKKQYTAFTIGFFSEDGAKLGKYSEDQDYSERGTNEFRPDGKVSTIEMHVID